ncbi:hypothetical protein VDGL01_11342 [Verticillium dahliae]
MPEIGGKRIPPNASTAWDNASRRLSRHSRTSRPTRAETPHRRFRYPVEYLTLQDASSENIRHGSTGIAHVTQMSRETCLLASIWAGMFPARTDTDQKANPKRPSLSLSSDTGLFVDEVAGSSDCSATNDTAVILSCPTVQLQRGGNRFTSSSHQLEGKIVSCGCAFPSLLLRRHPISHRLIAPTSPFTVAEASFCHFAFWTSNTRARVIARYNGVSRNAARNGATSKKQKRASTCTPEHL